MNKVRCHLFGESGTFNIYVCRKEQRGGKNKEKENKRVYCSMKHNVDNVNVNIAFFACSTAHRLPVTLTELAWFYPTEDTSAQQKILRERRHLYINPIFFLPLLTVSIVL